MTVMSRRKHTMLQISCKSPAQLHTQTSLHGMRTVEEPGVAALIRREALLHDVLRTNDAWAKMIHKRDASVATASVHKYKPSSHAAWTPGIKSRQLHICT